MNVIIDIWILENTRFLNIAVLSYTSIYIIWDKYKVTFCPCTIYNGNL